MTVEYIERKMSLKPSRVGSSFLPLVDTIPDDVNNDASTYHLSVHTIRLASSRLNIKDVALSALLIAAPMVDQRWFFVKARDSKKLIQWGQSTRK